MKALEEKVFVSTGCLPRVQPLASRLSLYRRHGLNAIELGANVTTDGVDFSEIASMDFQFLLHNYFHPPTGPFVLNLASKDSGISSRSLHFVRDAISLSAYLGAPFYSVHAGFITDPTGFGSTGFIFPTPSSPNTAQEAMRQFIVSLKTMIEHAGQLGIGLLVENNVCPEELRGKLLLQTSHEFLRLFRSLPSPHLGILLDTGHLNVSAHTLGFDRMTFVNQVAPYVRAFHVHDNDGEADSHQPVRAGSWVLDMLRRPEFATLPIVVEAKFDTIDDLRRHVNWLRTELGHE